MSAAAPQTEDDWAARDRAIQEALARSAAHDEACLRAIEQLPPIRDALSASPIFSKGAAA